MFLGDFSGSSPSILLDVEEFVVLVFIAWHKKSKSRSEIAGVFFWKGFSGSYLGCF